MSAPRKCAHKPCIITIEDKAPQARYCSRACTQAAYRERTHPDNQPTQVWTMPTRAEVDARLTNRDGVWHLDGDPLGRGSIGQARARARWRLGRPRQ